MDPARASTAKTIPALILSCEVCCAPASGHVHFGGEIAILISVPGVTITTIAGHCCYSCRAFFRRTVARVARAGLKRCRTGGRDCDVASVPGRGCSHCRYTRCLAIGMVPGLVQGARTTTSPRQHMEEGSNTAITSAFTCSLSLPAQPRPSVIQLTPVGPQDPELARRHTDLGDVDVGCCREAGESTLESYFNDWRMYL